VEGAAPYYEKVTVEELLEGSFDEENGKTIAMRNGTRRQIGGRKHWP
jgi:hypothetical protein